MRSSQVLNEVPQGKMMSSGIRLKKTHKTNVLLMMMMGAHFYSSLLSDRIEYATITSLQDLKERHTTAGHFYCKGLSLREF